MPAEATPAMAQVGVFGAGDAFRRMLEMLFKLQGQGRFQLAGDSPPDMAIVDLDGPRPDGVWQEFRARFPHVPAVVLSVRETGRDAERELRKPIRADALLSALESLRGTRARQRPAESSPARPVGAPPVRASSVPPIPAAPGPGADGAGIATPAPVGALASLVQESRPAPPIPLPEVVSAKAVERNLVEYVGDTLNQASTRDATACLEMDEGPDSFCLNGTRVGDQDLAETGVPRIPQHTLLDICVQAATEARRSGDPQFVVIHGLVEPIIFMPQEGGFVVTRLGKNRMRFICLAPLTDVLRVIVPLRGLPPDLADCPHVPYDQFIWEVALLTSRGRLPEGTDLHTPVKLKRWPNLTRFLESPGAMRIAALWAGTSYSLAETIRALSLAPGFVYAFYFAADSLGLIDRHSTALSRRGSGRARAAKQAEAPPPKAARPGTGMLGRLLKRLLA